MVCCKWELLILLIDLTRWLAALFICLDANFRLKRKNISNSLTDPSLTNGAAILAPGHDFATFLGKFEKLVIQDVCLDVDLVSH